MPNDSNIRKKRNTALITGASAGIGAATARLFAAKGWDLILTGNSHRKELENVAQEAAAFGHSCRVFSVDFADPASIDRFLEALDRDGLHFDLLVNNAGISRVGLIQDTSAEDWDALFAVNVAAVYRMCQYAVKRFLSWESDDTSFPTFRSGIFSDGETGRPVEAKIFQKTDEHLSEKEGTSAGGSGRVFCPGKILNVSSVWGVCGASCEAAYSAAKGAVNSFTKALARELAPSHIPVNAIAFGAVDTSMNAHLTREDREVLLEEIPAGRMATPQEAAEIIYQMAGFGDYVTGQILVADGGLI